MKSEDLLTALHDEYDIDLTAKGKEDVTTMCNLGEGLYERAMEKGLEKGIEKGIERGVEQENSERKDREATLEMSERTPAYRGGSFLLQREQRHGLQRVAAAYTLSTGVDSRAPHGIL